MFPDSLCEQKFAYALEAIKQKVLDGLCEVDEKASTNGLTLSSDIRQILECRNSGCDK